MGKQTFVIKNCVRGHRPHGMGNLLKELKNE
jgi:hypothetical protein